MVFLDYRWSRRPEEFGTGILEGVVAPETANNAATGAAMIPLLALGLPGGALTAMMMGVFQIHGMDPGPLIFVTSPDLVWLTFAAMFFANLFIFGLGWLQTKTVVHLLRIPFPCLAAGILVLATIGAFAVRNLVVDVWVRLAAAMSASLWSGTASRRPAWSSGSCSANWEKAPSPSRCSSCNTTG